MKQIDLRRCRLCPVLKRGPPMKQPQRPRHRGFKLADVLTTAYDTDSRLWPTCPRTCGTSRSYSGPTLSCLDQQ